MSNLPLAVNLWFVSLSSFSFIYLFCSMQMRAKRGGRRGNSGSKQTVPTAGVINLWIQIKDVICYSSPYAQLLFLHCWQDSWTKYWTYPYSPGGINVWIDRAIATSQLQKLSIWLCDFRSKICYGYPCPYSIMLCKWLMLRATQSSARSENSWPEDIIQ